MLTYNNVPITDLLLEMEVEGLKEKQESILVRLAAIEDFIRDSKQQQKLPLPQAQPQGPLPLPQVQPQGSAQPLGSDDGEDSFNYDELYDDDLYRDYSSLYGTPMNTSSSPKHSYHQDHQPTHRSDSQPSSRPDFRLNHSDYQPSPRPDSHLSYNSDYQPSPRPDSHLSYNSDYQPSPRPDSHLSYRSYI